MYVGEAPEGAVISGLAPVPDFLRTMGLENEPVFVVIYPDVEEESTSLKSAAILKVTPPAATPFRLRSAMAADKVG
jgi:hypothetical protein